MKNLFSRIGSKYEKWDKDNYTVESIDWDDVDYDAYEKEQEQRSYKTAEAEEAYEPAPEYGAEIEAHNAEAEEYIEDGYYAEQESPVEEAYYAEEASREEEEYYAEETSYEEEEYYAEEASYEEEEYYAEEASYEEEEYYAEEASYEEDEYYAEEEGYEEEDEYPAGIFGRKPREKKDIAAFWSGFLKMGAMDRIVTCTGIFVLILALITGGVYISARNVDKQAEAFLSVGTQLENIELIGEKGLMAVADAQMARQAAAEAVEEDQETAPEYNEEEYDDTASVELDMVSIQKDLKIKFTNRETDKLISNVPFTVTITDPSGKTETWFDDDMDGIIYKKGITPGKYKVTVNELTDAKYANYILPVATETIEVRKEIAYEKVDVKNEIKTEAQVNVSQEDTKKNETVVESSLTDTVEWVESTVVADTYVEVAKSTVPDPLTLIAKGKFMRTASYTGAISSGSLNMTKGGSSTLSASFKDGANNAASPSSISWSSSNNAVATVDSNGTVKAVGAGSATITYTATFTSRDVSGNTHSETVTGSCSVTVKEASGITLDKTAVTVYQTVPVTINATVSNGGSGVKAESSDTNIATVSVNGNAITITGVNAGSATITVKYVENGVEVKATCAVTVKVHPKNDKVTKLLDASGRQLYVLDGDEYREAVYADYYTEDQFFLRGESRYTGWQTIDGKVYFFDAAGKKVTGEHIIQGAKYNFASDGSLVTGSGVMGIDVSKWNGNIDWKAVKNSGVSYVIIRCGYRGSSQGALIEDPKYKANIKGAIDAGLKVGVYFFTQAVDEVEAVEEASMVLELVSGYKISYPIFLDVESSGGRADGIDVRTRTAVCKAFCETIQDAGYTAGVYANKTWLNSKLDAGALSGYKIWLAQYAATPTYTGRYDMWQYSSKGSISGISGNVDLNISYLGY